jgi:phosphate transport system permease protein
MLGSVLVAIVPLVLIFGYVVQQGLKVIDWSFLTEDIPIISRLPGGGMYPAIVGTIVITFWATAMAVPLGVLAAVYLQEYGGKNRLPALIRFMADVATGAVDRDGPVHLHDLGAPARSQRVRRRLRSALMLPIVIRSTEEMLRLVPTICGA